MGTLQTQSKSLKADYSRRPAGIQPLANAYKQESSRFRVGYRSPQ